MSNTPRTDGAPWIQPSSLGGTVPDCDERYVPISFARQLEKELRWHEKLYEMMQRLMRRLAVGKYLK